MFSLNVAAQENKPALMDQIHQVQQYLDSAVKRKVDARYIEVPAKPWRVILRYKETAFDVDYSNSAGDPAAGDGVDWQLGFKPPTSPSVGIWAGYRGTGVSFAKSLRKKEGTTLSFSTTGAMYGFNFRMRKFEMDEASVTATIYEDDKVEQLDYIGRTSAPVEMASLYLNGYYVFNGRRYSQAAAYNQSVIQHRSAGSLLAGATWYMSSFDFSDAKNAPLMFLSHNIGRIQLHQANIGIGYGYNFVPLRGLVVNAMAMPTLSVYNRVKVHKYDLNYELSEEPTDGYGQWNPETHTWANGKTHKPLPLLPAQTLCSNHITLALLAGSVALNALYFQPANCSSSISFDWSQIFVINRDMQKKRTVPMPTNHHVLAVRSWVTFLCWGLLICSTTDWRKAWISSAVVSSPLDDSSSNLLPRVSSSSFLLSFCRSETIFNASRRTQRFLFVRFMESTKGMTASSRFSLSSLLPCSV